MGLFDTVHLEKSLPCLACGRPIHEVQTKAFDPGMRDFVLGSCVEGPASTRIVEEGLHCPCRGTAGRTYLTVWRGILVSSARSLSEASQKLAGFSIESLAMLHYDSQRYLEKLMDAAHAHRRFLEALGRRCGRCWHVRGRREPEGILGPLPGGVLVACPRPDGGPGSRERGNPGNFPT